MTTKDWQEPAGSAPHDSGALAAEPLHLPWWKTVERTHKQQVWEFLAVLVHMSMFVVGLALLADFGSAAAPVVVALWGAWLVIFLVFARIELRRRNEHRLRREEWLRNQPPPAR